jgi:hypothetical protein
MVEYGLVKRMLRVSGLSEPVPKRPFCPSPVKSASEVTPCICPNHVYCGVPKAFLVDLLILEARPRE